MPAFVLRMNELKRKNTKNRNILILAPPVGYFFKNVKKSDDIVLLEPIADSSKFFENKKNSINSLKNSKLKSAQWQNSIGKTDSTTPWFLFLLQLFPAPLQRKKGNLQTAIYLKFNKFTFSYDNNCLRA